jgi:hypothetical protein
MYMTLDFAQTKISRSGGVLMLVTLLISGCGEFAYKRGANLSDLEIAKKACKAKESDSAAFEKCMADGGWFIQNLSKMEPLEADPVVEASAIPSDRRIENSAGITQDKQSADGHVLLPGSAQPATITQKRTDMMDIFKVSSWWKAGSSAENLKADTEGCIAKLGEAHRPNNYTQNVTRGLLLCMKEKGWSGLSAK